MRINPRKTKITYEIEQVGGLIEGPSNEVLSANAFGYKYKGIIGLHLKGVLQDEIYTDTWRGTYEEAERDVKRFLTDLGLWEIAEEVDE